MIIGGLEKLTLLDYPGKVAAIIFTQNCNFRCHFCYNPMLVVLSEVNKDRFQIKESDLFTFLKKRVGKIDGIVISGGEPTLHEDLPDFIKKIRDLGYKIKLDTNGTNPGMLDKLIKDKLIDYIAMDIKAGEDKYEKVVGVKVDLNKIKKSIKIIKENGLPYEFRTTIVPSLHKKEDIDKMGRLIKGADKWFLQKFKSDTDLIDKDLEHKNAYTYKEMEEMCDIAKKYVKKCVIR